MASPSRPLAVVGRPALFARLIKVEHSVYALPFAYAGALLADAGMPSWQTLVWVTVAMVAARSAAMALNRLIDAELDARNPRTAGRELPSGQLPRGEVLAFIACRSPCWCWRPSTCRRPAATCGRSRAAFVAYPYTKRFTSLCHYALGLTDGLAPAAAWVAVTGSVSVEPVLLFLAVGLWVGGFDVIYAIFDLEFDRVRASTPCRCRSVRRGRCASPRCRTPLRWRCSSRWAALLGLGWLTWPASAWSRSSSPGRTSTSRAAVCRRVGMGFMTVNGVVGVVYGVVSVLAVLAL